MKMSVPAFGLISGISTAFGLLPHILTLCFLLVTGIPPQSVTSLVVFTVGAKLLGEWLFWNHCKRRMDAEPQLKCWRLVLNQSLFSHPNVVISFILMLVDGVIDMIIINIALKTSIPPIWIFLSFLGCQALASPIQGVLSDVFSQKKCLIFANIMGIIALSVVAGFPLEKAAREPYISVINFLGLSSFVPATQMLFILCGKGLLANLTVIARSAIATIVKIETIEKFGKVR
ncbi:MAG: hypothetical protein KBA81_04145 [Rhabdochlamydiaceae bacterium]|nr:hypothetical protein [Rhabdochlamydiaceae bacterium]